MDIKPVDLAGGSGVRAHALSARWLVQYFLLRINWALHFLNAPRPAATA